MDRRQRKQIINKETDRTAIMLYSLKKRDRTKEKSANKKNCEIINSENFVIKLNYDKDQFEDLIGEQVRDIIKE